MRTQSFPIRYEEIEHDISCVFDQFNDACAAATVSRKYVLAGHGLTVQTSDPHYLDLTDRALASLPREEHSESRIVVGVAGQNGVPALFWGSASFEQRRLETALKHSRYRMHFFPDIGFWQLYDTVEGLGFQIMESETGYPDWDPGSPLRNLVHWCLASKTRALTHAGTLAVEGHGVLLAGAGGSGKSGTVISGVMRGMQTVGDDYVLLDSDKMSAHPLFTTLKQDTGGLERLGLSSNPSISKQTNWQNKHQFYWEDVAKATPPSQVQLHALLCPIVSGRSKSRMTKMSAKDAFLALAPSGVSQIPGDRGALAAIAANVVRSLPAYRVELGTNPDEVVETLQTFIAGVQG